MVYRILVPNLEVVEQRFVVVLCCEAGIGEIAVDMAPFAKTAVVKQFQVVRDDERDDSVSQAFLEQDQTPHTAISVLERMDPLELLVKVDEVFQCFLLFGMVGGYLPPRWAVSCNRPHGTRLSGCPTCRTSGSGAIP